MKRRCRNSRLGEMHIVHKKPRRYARNDLYIQPLDIIGRKSYSVYYRKADRLRNTLFGG